MACNGMSGKGTCGVSNQLAVDRLNMKINEKRELIKVYDDPKDIMELQNNILEMELAKQSIRITTRNTDECKLGYGDK